MSVDIGAKAPDFTLPTDGNGKVTLSKLAGQKVVLYFYPKDDTSGCTAEACGFRDALPDYGKTGAVVIGISKDSVAAHDKFKKKHGLPFILASDAQGDVCEKYGAWVEKSMYGRKYMGIERAHLSHRPIGDGARRLAQGAGAGPCRRGAEGGGRALNRESLTAGAAAILGTADPAAKAAASRALYETGAWVPSKSATPRRRRVRRGRNGRCCCRRERCRGAAISARPPAASRCLHALAHIELNAIDLGWDIVARFRGEALPRAFFDDWVGVAADEARHFALALGAARRSRRGTMAICRRMTGCGRRPRRPPTTSSPGWPSCRSCSKRAAST